jgi:predicted DNA-binding protein (MmcQ/YjbR family)
VKARQAVLRQCEGLPGSTLEYPFGEDTAVYKVGGKMFALVGLGEGAGVVTLKCEPDESEALRQEYPAITPGYYMNKRHWITLDLGASLPAGVVRELVAGSYELVVAGLAARSRPVRSVPRE